MYVKKLSISIGFYYIVFLSQTNIYANPDHLKLGVNYQNNLFISERDTLISNEVNESSIQSMIEIDKLIVDETISKAGHEFIELFFAKWNWPEISNGSFMMVITERPFRGISTQILITINELTVFESFLQTRYDILESIAESANEQASNYLNNYNEILKSLEGKDMSGTGIY